MRVGVLSLLTILFIGLKLTGHIYWSWIFVFIPMWIIPFIVISIIGIGWLIIFTEFLYKEYIEKHIKIKKKD